MELCELRRSRSQTSLWCEGEPGGKIKFICDHSALIVSKMPPNGPDEWRARIGHWENRKLRWYQAHCGSRPHVPLHLERMISEAPLLYALLLLSLVGKVDPGACVAGNGVLSCLGKLAQCSTCRRHGKVWATPLLPLFLALSLLLVVAGDVETNPGPISGEGMYLKLRLHVALKPVPKSVSIEPV